MGINDDAGRRPLSKRQQKQTKRTILVEKARAQINSMTQRCLIYFLGRGKKRHRTHTMK